MNVTVLGAGSLGAAMARRLAGQGHAVRIWNRHADKANAAADGVENLTAVEDAATAVRDAGAVLTVLPTADTVAEVVGPLLGSITGVWVQASTVGPDGAERLARLAGDNGVDYLDAPVSGSTEPAANGKLEWLVAGSEDVVDRVRPVLDDLGTTVLRVGDGPSQGSALKLTVNAWMSAATVVMSDTLDLCDALGVEHDTLRDALDGGPLAMPYALQKSELMDSGDFEPGFAVRNALKDLRLAADVHDPSPVMQQVIERLSGTVDAGHGDEDLAAVARTGRRG